MNQASGNEELLETSRDCFRFIIKFFEPINVSAVHIYHSALELSPLSSIVRRLYYYRRCSPFPRIVAGTTDAWEEGINLHSKFRYDAYTWSPCGQFVAAQTKETVEIRDPLSSELLSALTRPRPSTDLTGQLAYSPDGHFLASLSSTSLIIWDIQTGGVTREIECNAMVNVSLTWSLDGATICAIARDRITYPPNYAVNVYDVVSGATLSSGTLQSIDDPHLWVHNTSFRVITMEWGDQGLTIDTLEVGSILTKIESFHVNSLGGPERIGCFSPTAYRISFFNPYGSHLRILDVRKSECLLSAFGEGKKIEGHHCFSSDAGLFAVLSESGVHIWKYTSGRYTLWRELPPWNASTLDRSLPQFSPSSSSILGHCGGPLQVWRLDGPPIVAHPNSRKPLTAISHCGTYIATGYAENGTVTITNLLSPTPSQFIDTDMYIWTFALTGNVLLVWDCWELVAWRLTEKGTVDGISTDGRADRGDSIWTVSSTSLLFSVEDQTVVIEDNKRNLIKVYHTETGEVLEPAQASVHPRSHQYHLVEMQRCQHYSRYPNLHKQPSEDEWPVTWVSLEEGWVKDLEGKHRMWVPVEWRVSL